MDTKGHSGHTGAEKVSCCNGKTKQKDWNRCLLVLLLLQGTCIGVDGVMSSHQSPSNSLHYTSVGDRTEDGEHQMPGFYAGRLEPSLPGLEGPSINSTFDELRELEFSCAQIGNTVQSGLNIRALSYDKSTQELLITEEENGMINVLKGHLCRPQNTPCIGNAEWSKLPCVLCAIPSTATGRLGAFVQWKKEIYFIFVPDHTEHHTPQLLHHKQLQLRKLTGCKDKLPIYKKFDVEACSTVLAMYNSISHHMQPASEMAVLEMKADKGIIFLTQARTYDWNDQSRSSYYHVGMILVGFHILPNIKTPARTHLFHDEPLTVAYLDLPLANIGGIGTYKTTLCWSIFDRIHCGQMRDNGRTILKKTTVLQPGDAAMVCKGHHPNTTTGLTIASSRKMQELTLIFGCSTRKMGEGGAGVLYMKVKKEELLVKIEELKDSHGPVMAGSMFITEEVNCPTEGTPTNNEVELGQAYPGSAASALMCGVGLTLTCALAIIGLR